MSNHHVCIFNLMKIFTTWYLERHFRIYFYTQSACHILYILYATGSLKHILCVFSYETLQKCGENYSDLFDVLVFRRIYVLIEKMSPNILLYIHRMIYTVHANQLYNFLKFASLQGIK